jgi:GNAT superfamily N-acetyltransferase
MEVSPGLGYEPLGDGEIAALVTYLQMHAAPAAHPASSELALRRMERPALDEYRALFRRVGARWLWFSRLLRDDDALAAIIHDPKVELYAVVDSQGEEVGFLELDFREAGECELAFVGLIPELSGQGHGKWLLGEAVRLAWRDGITRVHVHTCTLDHPAALRAYIRAGFTPHKRAIERFIDPRLTGALPPDCAPQVPLVGTLTSASPLPES